MSASGSGKAVAEGITSPPIDDLLTKTDSKYKLVLFAAKRARQINAYYAQLGEGLLEYVGPLVDTHVQEKPLSIALREIDEGVIISEDLEPGEPGSVGGPAPVASVESFPSFDTPAAGDSNGSAEGGVTELGNPSDA